MATVRELITKILFKTDKTSLKQAEKSVEDIKKSLENVGKSAKTTGDMTKAAMRDIMASGNTTTATLKNMMQTGKETGNAIKSAMEGARASIDRVKGSAMQASAGLKTARAVVQKPVIDKQNNQGQSKLARAGEIAAGGASAIAVGAAVTAPLKQAVDDAAEFEYAMSKVQAVTGADAQTMQKLAEQARALGRATEFNAKQAAEAQYYLGLAGWKQEAILAATPNLLRLAIAGGTDLARTADIISDDMTAMGIAVDAEGKSVQRFSDIFAATMSNSNTTIEMMGETMKYAGTIAGTLGYSMEDVALAIGLMANNGTKASEAGTALRAVMTRLAAPPKEAAEAFAQIAKETGIVISPVDELTGKVKPLRQVFTDLRNALKGYNEVERVEFGKKIAGIYGTAGFNAIVKSTDADFKKLMDAIDNADGASERMAATMQNNLRGSMIATKSAAYDLNVELGKSMTPALREGNSALTGFLNGLTSLANEYPRVTSALTIFAGIAGGLLVVLGTVGLAVAAIAAGATAVGVAISGTVVAAIAGVIAVIAILLANIDKIKQKFGELKDSAGKRIDAIKGFFNGLKNSISNFNLDSVKESIGSMFGNLKGSVDFGFNFSGADSAKENVGGIVESIKAKFAELKESAGVDFDEIGNFISYLANPFQMIIGVINVVSYTLNALKTKFGELKESASTPLNFIIGLLNGIVNPLTVLCGLLDEAKSGFANLIANVESGVVERASNYTATQNNTFNLASERQLAPAMASTNEFFPDD